MTLFKPNIRKSAVIIGAVILVYWYFNPSQWLFPKCIVYSITGMYCPGCGSQRALHAILHGELANALRQNVLAVAFVAVLLVEMIMFVFKNPRLSPTAWINRQRYGAMVILIVIGVFTILRNIPLYPFTILSPFI